MGWHGKGPRGGRPGRRDPVPAVTSLLVPFRKEGESPDLLGAAEVWQQKAAMSMARAATKTFMSAEKWWLELKQASGA